MKFSEIVRQAITLLKDSGRVSYRALKREFDLDDDALEDLKEELIEARRVAADENGRILIWSGTQLASAPVPIDATVIGSKSSAQQSPAEASLAGAERRQLTVMFCDIVGFTDLSEKLDPEVLRDVVRTYHGMCATVIERFDGHIAQYLGDGLLVYFGYPTAHEDDPGRAVRAGLGVIASLDALNERIAHPIEVRIGVHTGQVVVGEIGAGEHYERLALGETPNVAARLQELTGPNSLVISEATLQMVRGLFETVNLGAQTVKGLAEPLGMHVVHGESELADRFAAAVQRGLSQLVGRAEEVGLLHRYWNESKSGNGQVVMLSGEAGIGKSRLVQLVKDRVLPQGTPKIEFRCSPYHQNTSFYPLIRHLEGLLHFEKSDSGPAKYEKLSHALKSYRFSQDDSLKVLAPLLSVAIPESATTTPMSAELQKRRTIETLVAWLVEESDRQALFCAWEDLHWADPSTMDVLELLLEEVPTSRVLAVLTFRPEFRPPWEFRSHMSQLTLNRLSIEEGEELVTAVARGRTLPGEVVRQIVTKTDGVPLFVEELTKMVIESDLVKPVNDHYELTRPLPSLAIPSTLQDSLMARLDRLGPARELAQLGATLGREFSYELISEVASLKESALQEGLSQLVDAELIYRKGLPPDARYTFKHALIQDTAYQTMLKGTRKQLHARIARVLEGRFPDTIENEPELLALHYTGAALYDQAIAFWQKAGERAVQLSANLEAVEHLGQGLELVRHLPQGPDRDRRELALLAQLGPALIAAKGYGAADTARCYDRAHELTMLVEDATQLFPVLYGCWVYELTWAKFSTAKDMAEAFLNLARKKSDTAAVLTGHRICGFSASCRGDFADARQNFEQLLELYRPEVHAVLAYRYGQDPKAAGASMLAWNLWHLGYPDQAVRICDEAVDFARQLNHSNTRGYVETFGAARLHEFRGDTAQVEYYVDSMMALCEEQKLLFWVGFLKTQKGWALSQRCRYEEAIATIEEGLKAHEKLATSMFKPHAWALLAQAYAGCGRLDKCLELLDDALVVANRTSENWITPELHRLKGEGLLQSKGANAEGLAEICFQEALTTARNTGAKSWELRVATSLARLRQKQNRSAEASDILAPVFDWFTEGFDTTDLVDAKGVLESVT